MQQNIVKCVMSCLIAGAACPAVVGMGEYVYSSNEYAFAPRDVEFQSAGLEYYATDSVGGQYTGKEGSVPVFFCKTYEFVCHRIVVRAAAVLCADRYLVFIASVLTISAQAQILSRTT